MFRSTLMLALAAAATASPMAAKRQDTTSTTTASAHEAASTGLYPYGVAYNTDMLAGGSKQFTIHNSCNTTQHHQLTTALNEMTLLAAHARDHILRWGHSSTFFNRYFGNASTAEPIGWYSRIVDAEKSQAIIRCDDPDRNCETQDAWAGHWRGENATEETVICELSFEIRNHLDSMCGQGYTVAGSPTNFYWASDLMHRALHVPTISEDMVHHYAEDYNDALDNAMENPDQAVHDSDALQWFALDVYAFDVAAPGVGCTGEYVPEEEEEETVETTTTASSATTSSPAPTTMSAAASAVETEEATTTSDADDSCHTHADGVVHCV
ncbi:hypothetical protein MBLNU230_g1738t1 [Neophaeotheca triangularis]